VARAAGLSRQALYLHFASKDTLFQGAATLLFDTALEGARAVLRDSERSLEDRIVAAFDAWHGDGLEVMQAGGHADELIAVGQELVGDIEVEYRRRFIKALATALRQVDAALKRAHVTEKETAEMLTATSKGLKHAVRTRAEYLQGMRTAARLVTAPSGRR